MSQGPNAWNTLAEKQAIEAVPLAERWPAETVYAKRHDFALWVGRAGLDGAEIAALEARVLGAPAAVREALFEIEAGAVRALHDRKAIFRAELCRPVA